MTIEELKNELNRFDPAMRVVVNGYEAGYTDPEVMTYKVVLHDERDSNYLFGKHRESYGDDNETTVLLLAR